MPGPSYSEIQCSEPDYSGVSSCTTGIDKELMYIEAYEPQQASQWCWAACIQMIFNYYGYEMDQASIVNALWGDTVNLPGNHAIMLTALNAEWTDTNGTRFVVVADTYNITIEKAARDLSEDMPLIIGTLGHAMVLTAMLFNVNSDTSAGNGPSAQLTGATVADPWPGNGIRVLTVNEWNNINLAVRIRITQFE